MNKTLNALMTKLTWQLQELDLQMQEINQQQTALALQLTEKEEQIAKACDTSALIFPEKEIARLNFIIQCQQQMDQVKSQKKELNDYLAQLQVRQLRLKTELKMLEKYQTQKQSERKKQDQQQQQSASDEWAILRRKPL